MAGRIRTIKPELLEDEKAAMLSDAAWRLFVSSWLLADDYGRFRAGSRYLAAQVWQDTTRGSLAEEALAELARAGRVRVYRVDGDTYAEIPTWSRHQRVDNAGKPRLPVPTDNDYVDLPSVSRRLAETRGGSPLGPSGSPPDPDHRPPTPTTDPERLAREGAPADTHTHARDRRVVVVDGNTGQPVEKVMPANHQVGELGPLIEALIREGNGLAESVKDKLDRGMMPTPKQLATLRKMREERERAPAVPSPMSGRSGHSREGPHYVDAKDAPYGSEPGPYKPSFSHLRKEPAKQ